MTEKWPGADPETTQDPPEGLAVSEIGMSQAYSDHFEAIKDLERE